MTKAHTTIEVSPSTYDMLTQIKTIFVSYAGENMDSFSDDKIIEILASGFLGSEDDISAGCGEGCGCQGKDDNGHQKKKGECCGGNCNC